jgi:hypothetical protein
MKFNRDYTCTLGVPPWGPYNSDAGIIPGGTNKAPSDFLYAQRKVTIAPPYTVEFDIRREFLASAQSATFKFYNLGETTRDLIYKDRFTTNYYARITFNAGYKGAFLPNIFDGTVYFARSLRLSRTNYVTEVQSQDGSIAYANSYSNLVVPAGYPFKDAIKKLNNNLVGVSDSPIIGTVPSTINQRPLVLCGPTFPLIQKLLPANVSATIDSATLKVLANTDALQYGTSVFQINASTGLLDPPVREGTVLICKILFEPRITIGQKVQLTSLDNSIFNNDYQVVGVSHSGIISPAVGGEAVTTVQLYLGPGGIRTLI